MHIKIPEARLLDNSVKLDTKQYGHRIIERFRFSICGVFNRVFSGLFRLLHPHLIYSSKLNCEMKYCGFRASEDL